jgi:hypothetical protein
VFFGCGVFGILNKTRLRVLVLDKTFVKGGVLLQLISAHVSDTYALLEGRLMTG